MSSALALCDSVAFWAKHTRAEVGAGKGGRIPSGCNEEPQLIKNQNTRSLDILQCITPAKCEQNLLLLLQHQVCRLLKTWRKLEKARCTKAGHVTSSGQERPLYQKKLPVGVCLIVHSQGSPSRSCTAVQTLCSCAVCSPSVAGTLPPRWHQRCT